MAAFPHCVDKMLSAIGSRCSVQIPAVRRIEERPSVPHTVRKVILRVLRIVKLAMYFQPVTKYAYVMAPPVKLNLRARVTFAGCASKALVESRE
jgi:hypothetical protein